jgi:YHS domain-containing protein
MNKPADSTAHADHAACAHHGHEHAQGHGAATAKDPVCGMDVPLDAGKPTAQHAGKTWHFCSQQCHDKFVADPAGYVEAKPAAPPAPRGTKYTCPMHPQIVRDAPGDCPICGMALEPMGVPAEEEGPNPELVDFTRRLWVGGAFTEHAVGRGTAARNQRPRDHRCAGSEGQDQDAVDRGSADAGLRCAAGRWLDRVRQLDLFRCLVIGGQQLGTT